MPAQSAAPTMSTSTTTVFTVVIVTEPIVAGSLALSTIATTMTTSGSEDVAGEHGPVLAHERDRMLPRHQLRRHGLTSSNPWTYAGHGPRYRMSAAPAQRNGP